MFWGCEPALARREKPLASKTPLKACLAHNNFLDNDNHRLFRLVHRRNRVSRRALERLKRSLQAIEYPLNVPQRDLDALLNRRARLRDSIQRAAHHLIDACCLRSGLFKHFIDGGLDRMALVFE